MPAPSRSPTSPLTSPRSWPRSWPASRSASWPAPPPSAWSAGEPAHRSATMSLKASPQEAARPLQEPPMLVAGVDSSTQSTKVVLCRAEDGAVIGSGSAPHPDGTEGDPEAWWDALQLAGRGLLERAGAVGVAAQQHGMVARAAGGRVVRPALLWNDLRSAPQAGELIAELGGPGEWARRTGSVPMASWTITKLRWMAEREPA